MLPQGFKPNLAVSSDKVKVQPKERYVSEKINGIHILFFGGVAYSRSLKPLPNKILQSIAKEYQEVLEGCDGEVIAGDKYAKDVLQRSNSFCMSADKEDDFKIYLFDKYIPDTPWCSRMVALDVNKSYLPSCITILDHFFVQSEDFLEEFEQGILSKGGEGCIVRDANALYKFGRSGTINPEIQKLKRFIDDEFLVMGYEQLESNQNEAKVNELGHTSRSTSKEGKVLVDKLGSIVLQTKDGIRFNCGTGFTDELRLQLWEDRDNLVGKLAKIKFFYYSKDDVPLLPVWLDFRSEIDT
jgi:DNA ligase 1